MLQPSTLDFSSSISLEVIVGALKRNRVAENMRMVKSWCNGWATSRRYHEDLLLPCLFGCQGHNVFCPLCLVPQSVCPLEFSYPRRVGRPAEKMASMGPCSESLLEIT